MFTLQLHESDVDSMQSDLNNEYVGRVPSEGSEEEVSDTARCASERNSE